MSVMTTVDVRGFETVVMGVVVAGKGARTTTRGAYGLLLSRTQGRRVLVGKTQPSRTSAEGQASLRWTHLCWVEFTLKRKVKAHLLGGRRAAEGVSLQRHKHELGWKDGASTVQGAPAELKTNELDQ